MGITVSKVNTMPAVMIFWDLRVSFSERYLVMSLDTVIGVPEQHMVNNNAKMDRETWYKPIPSVPIVLER